MSTVSTPKKQKPNPHPYAIKTTSTALLSRNSSSSSTASSIHHYVPPSPSPTRTGKTRYPSESPRPLPAPPSPAVLLTGGFKDDDDTPRRVQRAYSLPQNIKLPQDPKQWTPAEVSIYLSSGLNAAAAAAGHNLSAPAARDIITFVKDKKITGKSFLRLNEADLEEYGIDKLWRIPLLNASRALRRNVLHGRIWGNSTEHDYGDNDDINISSNSSFVITNRKRSLSTTSETRVRVRDMIDTLERSSSASSSELYEEGSCTDGKDTRSNRDKVHHRYRSLEQHQHQQLQLQQQGRLPQRGNVSTLFGTSGPAPDTPEQELEGKDSTITASRKNVNGNEPRLLPFPPTGPKTSNWVNHQYAHIVTPSHTGSSHPLPPPSPLDARNPPYYLDSNHVLNTQPSHHQPLLFPSHSQALNTFDYYELGFKNSLPLSSSPPIGPIRSPNSQRYVVQYNNAQSSTSSTPFAPGGVGGHSTGGGGRLLPYPPIMGEAELFHPKPRMGMGVGGLVGGLEDKLEVGGDETVYHSASETQPESPDSEESATSSEKTSESESDNENKLEIRFGSNATDVVEPPEKAKEGDEKERTLQNLSLAQSQARPRTTSEAREMGLDDTAKRISSSGSIIRAGGTKTRTRPRKRDSMMGEIGRKSGKMSDVDDLFEGERKKTTGALNPEVVEVPDSVAGGVESDRYDDKGLKTSLPLPDTSALTSISHQSTLDERDIRQREVEVQKGEAGIEKREQEVSEREVRVEKRELEVQKREDEIEKREQEVSESEMRIERREVEVQKRQVEIERREQEVSEREVRIERREVEVKEWYRAKLNEAEKALVDVPPPIPASTWIRIAESKWTSSPLEFTRRLCAALVLPVLGKDRTPGFLLPGHGVASSNSFTTTSTSTITTSSSTSLPTSITKASFWSLKCDSFLKRLLGATARGDFYIVLVSIGICVILLRGVVGRVLRVGGFRRRFRDFRGFGGR